MRNSFCACGDRKSSNNAKQCLACARKNKKKYVCQDCGKPVKAQRKRCNECDLAFRKVVFAGENSPRWAGGKPKCSICGKPVSGYKNKTCKACAGTQFSGENNPNWRGGTKISYHGYRHIYAPDHPNADKHGYVFEHRMVMSEHLGRPLKRHEVIHHIDGDRLNNSIENLKLHTNSTHHRQEHNRASTHIDKIIMLYNSGASAKSIANMMGLCANSILNLLKENGITIRNGNEYK